jgi:hypothetical protein
VTAVRPEGVIVRYLTVGGAPVDVSRHIGGTTAKCTGCGKDRWGVTDVAVLPEDMMRSRAKFHAETCRAMPNPNGAQQ